MSMTNRVVVIAGASRGIGAETARAFAARGDRVVLLARDRKVLRALAGEIGENALAIPCDVRNFAQVEQAVLEGVETFGSCDVLINNAALIEPVGLLHELDPKAWAQLIDVNVTGVFNGIRAVLHLMLAAGGGHVLTVSSGAAHRPYEGWSAYCASKAAVAMLTRSLHLEYGGRGIHAMGLSPGTVATDMQRTIRESGIGPVAQIPWEDHVPPHWPAQALVWMASEDARAHAGEEIRLRDPEILQKLNLS